MKYVVVPQSDLDRLEEARSRLWKFVKNGFIDETFVLPITSTMWHLTHRKYPKTSCQLELDFIG